MNVQRKLSQGLSLRTVLTELQVLAKHESKAMFPAISHAQKAAHTKGYHRKSLPGRPFLSDQHYSKHSIPTIT